MSLKSFIKKVSKIANEGYEKKQIETGIITNKTNIKGNILFNGTFMNLKGEILKQHQFKNLGIYYKNYYIAQDKYEGSKWGLFDKKTDKAIWIKQEPIHHEILVTSQETIITFSKETKTYKKREVDFDTILEYNFKGKLLSKFSMYDNISEFQQHHKKLELDIPPLPFLKEKARRNEASPWSGFYDYYRLNSMQIIPKNSLKDKRFQEGNWLLSCRHGSLIFILDKDTKKVVYSLNQHSIKSQIQGQHAVQMLGLGNLLIFDNGRYREESRIIELNPITKEIEYEYNNNFFTKSQGYVQKIKNNTYLITQSEQGRILLIENEEITWEYINQEIQNKSNSNYEQNYGKPQWIYRASYYKNT